MEPVPVVAPIVLPEVLPTLTVPAFKLMPVQLKPPLLEVVHDIFLMVLDCTLLAVPDPTFRYMAQKLFQ